MEAQLKLLLSQTEQAIIRKEWLEKSNKQLSTELSIRSSVVASRLNKISAAHLQFQNRDTAIKKKTLNIKKQDMINMFVKICIVKPSHADILFKNSNAQIENIKGGSLLTVSTVPEEHLAGVAEVIKEGEEEHAQVEVGGPEVQENEKVDDKKVDKDEEKDDAPSTFDTSVFIVDGVDLVELLRMEDDDEI